MATVLGHALAGANLVWIGCGRSARGPLVVGVLASTWFDLEGIQDVLRLGVMTRENHRAELHSLLVAVLAGLILGELGARIRIWERGKGLILALLCSLSHPLLDWANGGWGLPLFWPFSREGYGSPWPILGGPATGFWGAYAFNFLLWDLLIFGALTAGTLSRGRRVSIGGYGASAALAVLSHFHRFWFCRWFGGPAF